MMKSHGAKGMCSYSSLFVAALAWLMLFPGTRWARPAHAAREGARPIRVQGEVKNPGDFPWRKGITAYEAIQQAGGFTPKANRSRAVLLRGQREIVLYRDDLAPSEPRDAIRLEPGDVIRIDPGVIRVEGEVHAPGVCPLEHTRLREALLAAGGPTPLADLEALYIARGGQVIWVDGCLLLAGSADVLNPELEPGDVVHVLRAQKQVTISGEVRRPGVYTLEPGHLERLADLLSAAGGLTTQARPTHLELRRLPHGNGRSEVLRINMEDLTLDEAHRNPILLPGDHVVVPPRGSRRFLGGQEAYQIGLLIATLLAIVLR